MIHSPHSFHLSFPSDSSNLTFSPSAFPSFFRSFVQALRNFLVIAFQFSIPSTAERYPFLPSTSPQTHFSIASCRLRIIVLFILYFMILGIWVLFGGRGWRTCGWLGVFGGGSCGLLGVFFR